MRVGGWGLGDCVRGCVSACVGVSGRAHAHADIDAVSIGGHNRFIGLIRPDDYLMWMCLLCVCIDITCHTLCC